MRLAVMIPLLVENNLLQRESHRLLHPCMHLAVVATSFPDMATKS